MKFVVVALIAAVAAAEMNGGYEYVYQYAYEYASGDENGLNEYLNRRDEAVKHVLPKQAICGCELELIVTYDAEAEIDPDTVAAGIQATLSLGGIISGVVPATAGTPHGSHHTPHTPHSPHAPTVHNTTVHNSGHQHQPTVHLTHGGATVHTPHTPSPHNATVHVTTPHAATGHGMDMGMNKDDKAIFTQTLLVSINSECGSLPPFNPNIGFLESLLGATVTNIVGTDPVCEDCGAVLAELAATCPSATPTENFCQRVNTGIVCSDSGTDTDTGIGGFGGFKQTCAFDLSTNQGLTDYFVAAC